MIEALAAAPAGLGVTRLAEMLGMPKARIHRHLSMLREHGYVGQDPRTNQYRVGWQMFLLGRACTSRFDVMSLAKPVLERLRDQVRAFAAACGGREGQSPASALRDCEYRATTLGELYDEADRQAEEFAGAAEKHADEIRALKRVIVNDRALME